MVKKIGGNLRLSRTTRKNDKMEVESGFRWKVTGAGNLFFAFKTKPEAERFLTNQRRLDRQRKSEPISRKRMPSLTPRLRRKL